MQVIADMIEAKILEVASRQGALDKCDGFEAIPALKKAGLFYYL